jgi:sulfite exporter TauE/SafE
MNLFLLTGLLIGFGGSVHCVGMCGPLALSLPFNMFSDNAKWLAVLLYNIGRVTSYAAIGLLVGLLGRSVNWFGITQILSVILGCIIVLSVFLPKLFIQFKINLPDFISNIQVNLMRTLVTKQKVAWMYAAGIMNGLLPCGLVYMALAAALVSGSVSNSMLFMVSFGVGTIPTLLLIVSAGQLMKPSFRNKLKKMVPVISLMIGVLLVLRGLNLNIPFISPYLSPNLSGETAIDCH